MVRKFSNYIFQSFKSDKFGFSSRKLTCFAIVLLYAYAHVSYVDKSNVIDALMIDAGFILSLLGLVSYQQLTELKHNTKENKNEKN